MSCNKTKLSDTSLNTSRLNDWVCMHGLGCVSGACIYNSEDEDEYEHEHEHERHGQLVMTVLFSVFCLTACFQDHVGWKK